MMLNYLKRPRIKIRHYTFFISIYFNLLISLDLWIEKVYLIDNLIFSWGQFWVTEGRLIFTCFLHFLVHFTKYHSPVLKVNALGNISSTKQLWWANVKISHYSFKFCNFRRKKCLLGDIKMGELNFFPIPNLI